MSATLYDEGLSQGVSLRVRSATGGVTALALSRWVGEARGADEALLRRCSGRVLDVGCGPGRLTAALARRGVHAVGIDTSEVAVALTLAAGGQARHGSVFSMGGGVWDRVLLADGNIGIGGDPAALLRVLSTHLAPGGVVLVECAGPDTPTRVERLRLEDGSGRVGSWFSWAEVSACDVHQVAGAAGMRVCEEFEAQESESTSTPPQTRWFAALTRG